MRVFWAELVGTFALVFAGTGAIVANQLSDGAVTHPGIALTFGLVVLAMIYTFGEISGAHFNPAVSVGFVAAGRLPARRLLVYLPAQLGGALLASGLVRVLFPDSPTLGSTQPAGPPAQSLILEVVMTFLLMHVILSVSRGAKERGITAGIAIGATIALEALFGGPISGASMNPFRSLAPAVLEGQLGHLWIYLVGPLLGALLASPVCALSHGTECCPMRMS